MVHGFRGNHVGLLGIAKQLSDYKIIIPDLPGCGDTPPLPASGGHSIDGYAGWVRQFSAALDLKRFVLMGHSFGALIAAKMAADDASGIEQLVLVNPVSTSSRQLALIGLAYYRLGLGLPEPLGRRLLWSRTLNRLQSWLMMKTADPQLRRQIYAHHLNDLAVPYRRPVVAEASQSVLRKTVLTYAGLITVPTLLIGGERDDLAPLPAQRQLQQLIRGAQLVTIPGVGHLTHLEKPAEVAAIITTYLNAEGRKSA
jgi:pimeloyl-ACP methyl ester carboxylesterase